MPGIESFGRSERELKRQLADIERKVQAENKPLGELGVAIVQAATNCRDATKGFIQASTEKDRIEREIYIFYEFVYFFMHMTLREAVVALNTIQMEKLQGYLGPLISSTAIDSYFAHWPADLKERMTNEFYEKLNHSEVEYAEATQFETALQGKDRLSARLQALFLTLASNVANLAADDEQSPVIILPVTESVLAEWSKMRIDTLVANVARTT